jgi:hypothetical protein
MVATTILSRESWFPILAAGDEAGYVFERREAVDGTAGACDLGRCAERGVGRDDATRSSRRSEDARRWRSWALRCEESC